MPLKNFVQQTHHPRTGPHWYRYQAGDVYRLDSLFFLQVRLNALTPYAALQVLLQRGQVEPLQCWILRWEESDELTQFRNLKSEKGSWLDSDATLS
jgi:hypothetical protein